MTGIFRGSRTNTRPRASSGWSRVTVKKNRNAATALFIEGGRTPVSAWCSWKRRRSSAVAVSGERPRKAVNVRTWRI